MKNYSIFCFLAIQEVESDYSHDMVESDRVMLGHEIEKHLKNAGERIQFPDFPYKTVTAENQTTIAHAKKEVVTEKYEYKTG